MDTLTFNLHSCINAAEARIENGAKILDAFNWLRDELERTLKGEQIYDKEESQ